MICFNPECSNETNNPKYCSRSCSATHNNKISPKRLPEHKCKNCGKMIPNTKRYCSDMCKPTHQTQNKTVIERYNDKTLKDLKNDVKDQNKYVRLRSHARRVFEESGLDSVCAVCGYDLYIEVCHIKPISSFELDTKIKDINAINNLVPLCPNCHWELDNHHIAIEQV